MQKLIKKVYDEIELASTFQMELSGLERVIPGELNQLRNITKARFDSLSVKEQKDLLVIYDAMYRADCNLIDDTTYDTFEKIFKQNSNEDIGWFEENLKQWKKKKHRMPMGSLSKLTTVADIEEWNNKSNVKNHKKLVSEKLDGISLVLNYDKGCLSSAVTRGRSGSNEGQDILGNAIYFDGIQKDLLENITCSIRGEIVILKSNFQKINNLLIAKGKDPLKNTRNGASSVATKYKGRDKEILNLITFIAYDVRIFEDA